MQSNRRANQLIAGFAVLLLAGGRLIAQTSAPPPTPAPSAPLEDCVRTLAAEVKELNATVQELRSDMTESRAETKELREQLRGAMQQLSALRVNPAESVSKSAAAPEVVTVPTAPVPPSAPQVSSPPSPAANSETSTEARLDRLEEDQQLLQSKVDEQHQTKVESFSKYRVKLDGIALFNLFGNRGTVDNQDIPGLALPRPDSGTSGSVGATLRQSEIGLQVYGPTLWGAQTSGNVNFDFMGGFAGTTNGTTDPLVRLRTGIVRFDWANTSIVAGQDAPFFSPLSPTSFASLGYPAMADAGNLWTWTPQLRVERRIALSDASRFNVEFGILDPLSGEPSYSPYYRVPDAGEQSRIPAFGSRVAWVCGWGAHPLTLGAGGYYSRQNYGYSHSVDAWAGTLDWEIPLERRIILSGEFYRGRGIGGLGAAEGRSILYEGSPGGPGFGITGLDTIGGWTQLKFRATNSVEFNAAYGEDNPYSRELNEYEVPALYAYPSVGRNQNAFVNVIYRPRGNLLFAFEYRYLDTLQITNPGNTAGTLNLSMGVLF
jgi:outer membrane murein-binding lipoprotein Lpp